MQSGWPAAARAMAKRASAARSRASGLTRQTVYRSRTTLRALGAALVAWERAEYYSHSSATEATQYYFRHNKETARGDAW